MKKWLKNIAAIGIGLFLCLLLVEIVLHIYNPFQSRVQGGRITLPVNARYLFDNTSIKGIDSQIVHTKNKIGLRGPEISNENMYRIFCVGGSTTECFYLSDGQDWPAQLMSQLGKTHKNIWINNAGLDGHSTRGHLVLLRDHLLQYKPKMIIFLIGCNDLAAAGLNRFEGYHIDRKKRYLEYSEIYNSIHNYQMTREARKKGMGHSPVNFLQVEKRDTTGWNGGKSKWSSNLQKYLPEYAGRVKELGDMCKENNVIPVFVTQPTILVNQTDLATNLYFGSMNFEGESALHYWFVLNKYNRELMRVSAENGWICIDGAAEFTASSENYYDFFHYTKKGAMELANIIFDNLEKKQLIH